jgi:V/A-type H+-transporting ATPase subunit I
VNIGKNVAISGAIGLVLTQGRDKKNIIMKLFSGVASLYGITSYFSDLMSYSRLLALGMSSAVIAMVVNTMATMAGTKSIGGILMIIIVSIIGHLFNMALGLLSAYVHAARLQYIEFFGKFYEGGGKEFKPFKLSNKYITIKD